ncbi:hypothetical protein NM688_g8810 [Phlebia brevispora]|uniref:Uncharacterized protein n=1 Tax=Phlebia brevispora TaxID=194682 RepID=A0ACC1RMN6_9APHY|nr:hypothetical protein NM688_g8810 [Phlebia brevispora]
MLTWTWGSYSHVLPPSRRFGATQPPKAVADQPLGIDVCLSCFNGGCLDSERSHMRLHVAKSGHTFTVNIRRKLKPSANRAGEDEPPAKMSKLMIVEEREEDKYEFKTVLKCWKCNPEKGLELPELSEDPRVKKLITDVMQSMSSARQSEVKSWEEEITACEHTLTLEQFATGPIEASGLAHCSKCDLKENLWLCLTCGSLGCGRQQFGGLGGNGHGLQHYEESHHPVSVKLGTITPEGDADIYCYLCNDSRLDPELASHLAVFGINVQTQTKTEKSITELASHLTQFSCSFYFYISMQQIEQNLKFDFSLTGEDGKALEPVFGPGLTGLANLGNSCYMASVLQTTFALPSFQEIYFPTAKEHWASFFQEGIRPIMFKRLIGKGHEEFSTMRQQDSEEFFTHFISSIRRQLQKTGKTTHDPTAVFQFGMEQRLQCNDCQKVRYRVDSMDVASVPVPKREKGTDADGKTIFEEIKLKECLDILTGVEALEYTCPSCHKQVIARKQTRFATFPQVLVVHAKKFQLVNWVPTKLDIPIVLPEGDVLQLDGYIGHGLQPGETELPEDKDASSDLPEFNAEAMAQLEAMGFPTVRCQKALLATGNNDANAAMEWLFQHMEDPDIDAPIQLSSKSPEPSAEQIVAGADGAFTWLGC